MIREFYIFRHGQTDWNLNKRIQGHSDIPLNETGRKQATSLIPILDHYDIEIIYTSDLSRAKETGTIVANALDIEIIEHSDLREAHFGEAEGLSIHEVQARFGQDFWNDFINAGPGKDHHRFPGGESRGESAARALKVIEKILEENKFKKVGISTHGGILRNLLNSFVEGAESIKIPNCVVYKLEHHLGDKTWRVTGPIT